MGKKVYLGVGSKAHTVKKLYLGVSGTAHKVKKGFIGVGNKAHQFFISGKAGNLWLARPYNISTYKFSGGAELEKDAMALLRQFSYQGYNGYGWNVVSMPTRLVRFNRLTNNHTHELVSNLDMDTIGVTSSITISVNTTDIYYTCCHAAVGKDVLFNYCDHPYGTIQLMKLDSLTGVYINCPSIKYSGSGYARNFYGTFQERNYGLLNVEVNGSQTAAKIYDFNSGTFIKSLSLPLANGTIVPTSGGTSNRDKSAYMICSYKNNYYVLGKTHLNKYNYTGSYIGAITNDKLPLLETGYGTDAHGVTITQEE